MGMMIRLCKHDVPRDKCPRCDTSKCDHVGNGQPFSGVPANVVCSTCGASLRAALEQYARERKVFEVCSREEKQWRDSARSLRADRDRLAADAARSPRRRGGLAERVRVLEQVLEEYANHAEDSGWLNLAAEIRDRAAKR